MDFIQIGDTFLRIDSILRVQMYNYEAHENNIPMIRIYTKEIQSNPYGELSGSDSQSHCYSVNSPEGQAFLGWLQSHTKRLLPSEILDKAKQA
jgi:hypothetical protein